MKDKLKKLLRKAIASEKIIANNSVKNLQIEISRSSKPDHGDFSSNIALKLSKQAGLNPFELATSLSSSIDKPNWLKKLRLCSQVLLIFLLGLGLKPMF